MDEFGMWRQVSHLPVLRFRHPGDRFGGHLTPATREIEAVLATGDDVAASRLMRRWLQAGGAS